MEVDADTLTRALLWALGAYGEPLLTEVQARRRAEAISAEMGALGFALRVFPWKNVTPSGAPHPYPAYHLDDPRYSLNTLGPGERGQFAVNCPGISCGDLLKFGRACELKRELLGKRWPKELRDNLRDRQSHLDAVEELLWLGRFRRVHSVQAKFRHANRKDADWVLKACIQPLQIEVKNRRREAVGIIDGAHRGRENPSWHQDLVGKFVRDEPGCLNIACITTYFEADDALRERACELLEGGEPIDAVIIWSYHCPGGNHLAVFASNAVRPIVDALLAPVAREDSQKLLLITHLMRNSEEQRVATLDETLARLRES